METKMLIESKTLDGKYFDSMQDFNPETGLGKLKVGRKTLVFVEDSEVGKPYCFFKAASNGQYKFLAKVEGKANAFWLFAEKGSSTVNAPYITEVELEKAGALKKVKEVLKQPQFKSGKKEKDSVWERISPVDENAPKIERVEVKKGQEVRLVDTGKKITDTPQEQIGVADKAKKETAAVLREGQVVAEGSQVIQKNTPSEDLQPAEADIPQSNDNNEEKKQNKKEKSKKENKGGNMKTKKNPVYDENNNEVAQISSDKVGGFEGAIYIIDGVAIGDDGKEGTKLGKWDAKAKAITPIEEKKPNGTRHTVTRTDDGVVRGVVDKAHGKGGFMQDIKNEIETYVQQKVSIKRQDNTAEYTDAEEKKIKGFAKFALDTVVKGKNLSEDEAKVVEARRQEMLDYAERCIKNKFPVEKKEVVIDFDYLAGKIRDRVQKGARMAFTMSDDEKKDIREILANATPEKIRKIAYGDSKKTQGLAHDMINAEEQLAKAGGAIKISGSPELQSVIKNVGIVDNKETKTAHVSINELKNLEGVYYKLGVVPAYASALVDFVVKKYKNPQISEEDKSKLVDIAHELVLSEILTDQDVYALVDDAAMQKSFDSPVHVYANEIRGYTAKGGVYHPGIVDDLVKINSYDRRSSEAFKAADQFVAAHEEDLVKEGADRDEVVEKWAEYFIKVAQTKRHLNPVVGEVAAMGQLTEDQQNEIIGFVNNYKKLDDIIDLALVTKTPVENKVVVEKVKHIAEKVKMQEKLDSIRTSKTYAGIVDTIKEEAEEAQKVEGCRKSAEEIVNNTVKDGNFTDEEKAQLVENVENMIREDAGLPPKTEENTAAPVVPEEVNEPEQNEPTPSNEEENVPGDVETPENTENEEDQINNVEKPEDTNKPAPENTPDKPENNEKPAKPVDPREVVISDPIKIDGGKRGNYQGVFVLGPHPEASNTTERGLYFVDLEKLRAAGKTLDDLKNNFDAEELFGEKQAQRYGYAVKNVQVGHDKNGKANYFRLDYYRDKKHHGKGRNSSGKKPRIQSYTGKEADKAYEFLKENNMLDKTKDKKFVKVFGAYRLKKAFVGLTAGIIAAVSAAGLATADGITGNLNAQADAARQFGLNEGSTRIEQVVNDQSSLLSYAGKQPIGMSALHGILSNKPQFKTEKGFLKPGQHRNYASDTASGFGDVVGEQVAAEIYDENSGLMQDENNKTVVYYPTDPTNPNFTSREDSEKYLKGLGYSDAETKAFLDSYEKAYERQYKDDKANDPVTGTEEQPPVDDAKEVTDAVTTVLGIDKCDQIFSSNDGYVFAYDEEKDAMAKITLGEGETLAEKITNATDIIKAKKADDIFDSLGCKFGLSKYLDKKYSAEGGAAMCTMYVTTPVSDNRSYTPLSFVVVTNDADKVVKVIEQKLDTVTLGENIEQNNAEIVVAATLASDKDYRYSQAKGVSVKKNNDISITHNGTDFSKTAESTAEEGRSM